MHSFDRDSFLKAASGGANFIPVSHSWPADLETPLTTWLKVSQENDCPGVLLESVEGGETLARWSVVAVDPLWTVSARGDQLIRKWRGGRVDEEFGNPFEWLRTWLKPYHVESVQGIPPLGQLYGMWGYELIKWIEPKVPIHSSTSFDPPDGVWMLMDSILIFDQVKRLITAVAYADLTDSEDLESAFESCMSRIENLERKMAGSLPRIKPLRWQEKEVANIETQSNFTKNEFEEAVRSAKNNIAAGDVFQLVLSQRLEAQVDQNPFELYRSLRMVNPSPYMAFFDFKEWQLIGSSPEVMVKAEPRSQDREICASLRPIAGTRPRGLSMKEDIRLEKELLEDPKEIAEHVMLVDLGRNDLGRVCKPGTVEVKDLMVIEKYSHVMHIVSEVQGLLSPEMDVWDLLMASFPAGTVSGAPKIRAMQLINHLEKQPRGPYSGVYGSLDLGGALNTAITIRTMVVKPIPKGGCLVKVQAGAGIVSDSIPSAEYQETINKANGMLTAIACLQTDKS